MQDSAKFLKINKNPVIRWTLVTVGWIAIVLGIIGIFLPLLPTTPFLLLAAGCFARSSEKFHSWLLNHKYLGPYIHLYLDGKGIPFKAKCYIISVLWITMAISIYLVPLLAVKILLVITGSCVTIYLLRLPNLVIASKELN